MNRLRTQLIVVFVLATGAPLVATVWLARSLLDRSLEYSSTAQLDRVSRLLEGTARELYQLDREILERDAREGRVTPQRYAAADRDSWPADVAAFWESGESTRFVLGGRRGDQLLYLVREEHGVASHPRELGVQMEHLSEEYRQAREAVDAAQNADLRRGFSMTLIILTASIWLLSLLGVFYIAHRISRPIEELTTGLGRLAADDLSIRLKTRGKDEVGRAISAFNRTAGELSRSRDRLVYLTQVASWQTLARKMAHEVKNSLTPIRLTVEEIRARRTGDSKFLEQAVEIVVSEIETLERRIRAFSEFAAEPAGVMESIDLNDLVRERVALLAAGHPEVRYDFDLADTPPRALADSDSAKGILTNLIGNAAEAAGAGGAVLLRTRVEAGSTILEVHDSGPGLSADALKTLFEPTISFKPGGMGLGLSIAKKSAMFCRGDLLPIESRLGGAAFRVILPSAT